MPDVRLIIHNIRSAHNVGSLLRTAEGLGITKIYITGYSPYPLLDDDARLPHISSKVHKLIQKTALGAESYTDWAYEEDIGKVLGLLKMNAFTIAGLEQAAGSTPLSSFKPPDKIALLLGSEVTGIEPDLLSACEIILEIPMHGQKESFNVAQAAAIALYHLTLPE